MKKVTIVPYYPEGHIHMAFLINERFAIYGNGETINMFEVKPVAGEKDKYTPAESGNYVTVAYQKKRTHSELEKIVTQLKTMTAIDLIMYHFSESESEFDINNRR